MRPTAHHQRIRSVQGSISSFTDLWSRSSRNSTVPQRPKSRSRPWLCVSSSNPDTDDEPAPRSALASPQFEMKRMSYVPRYAAKSHGKTTTPKKVKDPAKARARMPVVVES